MTDLSVEVCGIRLANPTILASGVLDETGRTMAEVARAGAGAVVTKSIGLAPRQGHDGPCVVELDIGLLNAMGLPNPGIDYFGREIAEAKKGGVPVIGSVIGGTSHEMAEAAHRMAKAGVDAVELNLSCPHAKGLGSEVGSTPEGVEETCKAVASKLGIPFFAKLTPNTSSITELAAAAEKGGADAIVAINTIKGMAISPEARRPILGNKVGGLSGPAIKPVGVRCVYEIYETVGVPIIGVGGISNHRDAIEYMMAGARAVEIGTAVWTEGLGVFKSTCEGIARFMDENRFGSIREMVGVAHRGGA